MTHICQNFLLELAEEIENTNSSSIFIITDENAAKFCLPIVQKIPALAESKIFTLKSGDENKTIESVVQVWQFLTENGATRKSLIINLGGGMVTDLGGFAAATFKRGAQFINVSTTLLGAVDAATGGKTGFNFLGYKNEIGAFADAKSVLINTDFFQTLGEQNFLSGFAEMLKHAVIDSREEWNTVLQFDLQNIDYQALKSLLERSIAIKERIVAQDPTEKGIRKALNFGHTFGHSFESFSHLTPTPALHGYAVAWGMFCEMYLSHIKLGFSKDILLQFSVLMKEFYGSFSFSCTDYETLFSLMTHDKKNDNSKINFTLLSDIGQIHINQTATKDEIFECLDYFREC